MQRSTLAIALLLGVGCASARASDRFPLLRTKSGAEFRWESSRFPLRVGFTPAASAAMIPQETDDRCLQTLRRITAEFNVVAGRDLFRVPQAGGGAFDVRVSSTAATGAATTVSADRSGRIRMASVALPCWNYGMPALVAHELLHALGFAHNHRRMSQIKREMRWSGPLPGYLRDDLRALFDHRGSDVARRPTAIAALERAPAQRSQ